MCVVAQNGMLAASALPASKEFIVSMPPRVIPIAARAGTDPARVAAQTGAQFATARASTIAATMPRFAPVTAMVPVIAGMSVSTIFELGSALFHKGVHA